MSVFESDDEPRLGRQIGRRLALGSLLVVLFSATAVASAMLLTLHGALDEIRRAAHTPDLAAGILDPIAQGEPQTILLLGSDRRYADGRKARPRSDTMMVVHLDPDRHATAIMSIPRDLKARIPGHGSAKINEAYHVGGAQLAIRTVRRLLGIPIHHVVDVHFGAFSRAVDRLGCVYADIDRRYFNDNSHGEDYATIDLKPGYQKLCGDDALDYVRFRHEDSDFVRAARQQEFLRQAKSQIGLGALVDSRDDLLRILGTYTDTDIMRESDAQIYGFVKLALAASRAPIAEVRFPADDGPDGPGGFVFASRRAVAKAVARFEAVGVARPAGARAAAPAAKHGAPKGKRRGLAPGLVLDRRGGEDHILAMDVRLAGLGMPVFYPAVRLGGGLAGYARDSPRSYEIFDRDKHRHRAYRIVLWTGVNGQYYGVQGTTWKTPPILDDPTDEVSIGGRRYKRYFDGHRIRLIAFETAQAVYWVSNTLQQRLSNRQMMDVARSLRRIGD
ncbi:MAG: polyisoprenyl-teichoic acid--peptidoglycan teichoic acid transferase [Solirubrobacteraceae bacterium]|nr:polyisoprenyl-teichoic acid--peptidoglycan teichoic acid transferase [Solirubrobacteraceae bacterium]